MKNRLLALVFLVLFVILAFASCGNNEIIDSSTVTATDTATEGLTSYPIRYELNGGTNAETNPATYTVEDAVALADPTRTGYAFAGWSDNGVIAVGSTGEKTFTASWTAIDYPITYNLDGGTNAETNPATYTIEDAITLADPIKDDYLFAGWSDGGMITVGSTGEKTFTASWTPDPGLAKLLSADGFEKDGTSLTTSLPNATENYSFLGQITVSPGATWQISTDVQGINVIPSKTVPLNVGDNTLYLLIVSQNGEGASLYTVTVRRRPIWTLTFNPNGGTAVGEQAIEEDAFATPPTSTRAGYTLAWDYDFSQPVKRDATVTASWTLINYAITYSLNGGTNAENNPSTYTVEDSVNIADPTRTGYTFTGWSDGGTIALGSTGEKTFAAGWQPIYTVKNGAITGVTDHAKETFTELAIPTMIDEMVITAIADGAFADCTEFANIIIPDSVVTMGEAAFVGCSELTSITIPDSVTSIRADTFENCTGLTSVTIGNGVTSIGAYAFCGCSKLTSITIPDSVTSIGERAFYRCSGLTSITISDSVTSIGYYAFYRCSGLTSVYYTGDIESWCGITFEEFANLLDGVRSLYLNGVLLTELVIPDTVTAIKDYAFLGYSKLTSITIPDSVTSIGASAFAYCTGLTSVTIPNSVTSIGCQAFYNCSKLTSITIPDSVTSIGNSAFYGCSRLTSVYYTDDIESWCEISFGSPDANPLNDAHSLYLNGVLLTELVIPDTVTAIKDYAFVGCSNLTLITIPDSVTSIGNSAFYGCSGLTSVTIPDSVMSIETYTFCDCSGLTSITIGTGVTSIESSAFYNCSGLESIISYSLDYPAVGNCLIEAKNGTLIVGCKNSVIPTDGSVTSIGDSAFGCCSGLTSITIPDTVTSIGFYAFSGCSSLTSVTIFDGVTSVENGAFAYCSGLTSITFTGTKAQWSAISKGERWNKDTGSYTIHCTDGDIAK